MFLMFLLGYKLCKHIVQALSHQCAAICNAISHYNDLAPIQKPPCPLLMYSEVIDYCTFSEFEILKHSDHDILSKEWAILANQQAANKHFKIKHGKEEIHHCNIKVTHVQAWVDEDNAVMSRAVAAYEGNDPAFTIHLKVLQVQHHNVNDYLCTYLKQIYKLPGYCGSLPPVAASSAPPRPSAIPLTALNTGVEDHVDGDHIDNMRGPHGDKDKDKDELHGDEDKDKMLTKIMV